MAVQACFDNKEFNLGGQIGANNSQLPSKFSKLSPECKILQFPKVSKTKADFQKNANNPSGHVRHYDPEIGRWISRDPILFGGRQTNLYGYSFYDPINFVDPSGLAAGDEYPTEGGAARDALGGINPTSTGLNREFGGYIYRTPNGYTYDQPNMFGPTNGYLGTPPDSTTAFYHTHGAFSSDPNLLNDNFSYTDENLANRSGLNSYLMGPNGMMQRQGNGCHQ